MGRVRKKVLFLIWNSSLETMRTGIVLSIPPPFAPRVLDRFFVHLFSVYTHARGHSRRRREIGALEG